MIRKIPQSPLESDKLGESQKWYDGKGTTYFWNKQAKHDFGVPLYQQKAIKTCRMEHQDTKLTSMRPRLKELNDNP